MKTKKQTSGREGNDEPMTRRSSRGRKAIAVDTTNDEIIPTSPSIESSGRKRRRAEVSPSPGKSTSAKKRPKEKFDDTVSERSADDIDDNFHEDNNASKSPTKTSSLQLREDMEIAPESSTISNITTPAIAEDAKIASESVAKLPVASATIPNATSTTKVSACLPVVETSKAPAVSVSVTPPLIQPADTFNSSPAASTPVSGTNTSTTHNGSNIAPSAPSMNLIGGTTMPPMKTPVSSRATPPVISIPPPQNRRPMSTSPAATPPLMQIPSSSSSSSLAADTPLISSIGTSMSPSIALLSSTLSSQNDFTYSSIPSPPLQSPRPLGGAPPPPLLPTRSVSESHVSLPRYPSASQNLASNNPPRPPGMTSSMSSSALLTSSLWPGSTPPDTTYLTSKSVPDRSAFTHVASNPSFTAASHGKTTPSDEVKPEASGKNRERLLTKSLSSSNISTTFQGDMGGQMMLSGMSNARSQAVRTQSISSGRASTQSPLSTNPMSAPESKKGSAANSGQSTPRQSPSTNKERGEESVPVLHRRREIATTKLVAMERKNLLSKLGAPFVAPRLKSHWDYILDELQWLSIDYRQERRWAKSHCKTKAAMCAHHVALQSLMQNDGQWTSDMLTPPPSAGVKYDYWLQRMVTSRFIDGEVYSASRTVSSRLAGMMSEFWSVNSLPMDTVKMDIPQVPMSDLPKPINRTVEEFNRLIIETKEKLSMLHELRGTVASTRVKLTRGQLGALNTALATTSQGYGVALRGESASGKTVIASALLHNWRQEIAEPILLVTTKSRAHRWKYEFGRICDTQIDTFSSTSTALSLPPSGNSILMMYIEEVVSGDALVVKQLLNSRRWGGALLDMRIYTRHSKVADNIYAAFNAINSAITQCFGRRAMIWYKNTVTTGLNIELLRYLLPSVFTSVQLVDKWKVWYTREQSGARTADSIISEDLLSRLFIDVGKVLVPVTPGTNKESEKKPPSHAVCTKRYDIDASKVELTADQRRKYGAVVSMCAPWLCGDSVMLFAQSLMLLQRVCYHSDMLYVSYASENGGDVQRGSPSNHYSCNSEATGTPREFMQLAMDVRAPVAVSPGIVSHHLTAGASIESMSPGHETKSPKLEALVDMINGMKKSRIIVLADTMEQQLLAHQYLSKSNIDHLYGGIDTTLEDSWAYYYASEEAVIEFNRLAEDTARIATNQIIVLSEKFYLFQQSSSISPVNADVVIVLSQNWLMQPEIEPLMFDTRDDEMRQTKVVYVVSRNSFEEVIFYAEKSLTKFYNTLSCMTDNNVALSPLAVLQGKALSELQLSGHMIRASNFQTLFLGNVPSLCPSLCPMLKELFRSNESFTSSDSLPSEGTLGTNLLLGKGRGKGTLTRAPDGSVAVAVATAPPVDNNLRWLQRSRAALDLSCYMFSNMWGYLLHPDDVPPLAATQDTKNTSTSPPPNRFLGVVYIGPCVALAADDASLDTLAEHVNPTIEYQRLLALYAGKHDITVANADDSMYELFWCCRKKLTALQLGNTACGAYDIGLLGYLANILYNRKQPCNDMMSNEAHAHRRDIYEDSANMLYYSNVAGTDVINRHHDICAEHTRNGDSIERSVLVNPLSVASGQDVLNIPSWATKSSSVETSFTISYNTKNGKSSKKVKQQKSEPKKKSTVTSNELYAIAAHLNTIIPDHRFKSSTAATSLPSVPSLVHNPYITKPYERPRHKTSSAVHVEYPPDAPGLELSGLERAILHKIKLSYPSSNDWFLQEVVNEANAPLSLSHTRSARQLLRRDNVDESINATCLDYDLAAQNFSPSMLSRIAEVLQVTDTIRKRRKRGRSIDILGSGDADAPDTIPDVLLLQNPSLLAECHASHRSVVQNSFANAALNAVQVFDKLQGKLYPARSDSFNNPVTSSSNQLLLQQLTSASSNKTVMSDRSFSSPPLLQGQQNAVFPSASMPSLPPAAKSTDEPSTFGKHGLSVSKQQQLLLSHPLLQSPLLGEEYVKKLEHIITTRHLPEFETKLLKTLYSQDSADQQKIVLLKALLSKST